MLKTLFAPQFVFLYLLAASTIYVHFRGRVSVCGSPVNSAITRPISPLTTC